MAEALAGASNARPTADAERRVCEALAAGELSAHDLTARRLARFLGGTTSLLYHHYGSLDGFLAAVARIGFADIERAIVAFEEREPAREAFERFAAEYLAFALEQPALYRLVLAAQAPVDGQEERRSLAGRVRRALVRQLGRAGSLRARSDGQLFAAALHGLAAEAERARGDRDTIALEAQLAARRLVAQMFR